MPLLRRRNRLKYLGVVVVKSEWIVPSLLWEKIFAVGEIVVGF